jgi:hypothetical protein
VSGIPQRDRVVHYIDPSIPVAPGTGGNFVACEGRGNKGIGYDETTEDWRLVTCLECVRSVRRFDPVPVRSGAFENLLQVKARSHTDEEEERARLALMDERIDERIAYALRWHPIPSKDCDCARCKASRAAEPTLPDLQPGDVEEPRK